MELKEYQQRTLNEIKRYLELLADWRKRAAENPELEVDFPQMAWKKAEIGRTYHSRQDGCNRHLPNFCLKIPTGGGKTFLAVKAIDLINTTYLKKKTGLVLWVVPTTQIYNQTIDQLRDRDHPYRQHLDIASGGRTTILEKTDRFSPLDVTENLVVMMLMLQSASRLNKETLRMFKDSGAFTEFFPPEDHGEEHRKLIEHIPNLEAFGDKNSMWHQVKTSLGNTLRVLTPMLILDEGHKAYSETAQETLRGFNPSLILELSATPADTANVLVDIRGVELNREEMIKLDLHIVNNASPDWKFTMAASTQRRDALEQVAREYEANTNVHIRPICLVQVERTGKDQRASGFIHSEDVREYLTGTCGIPADQVAVTSAELKEIEGLDLFSRDCPVRYIITKQALQEGWDCAFAYVLTVLTNPGSKNSLTQLVGRILRQPYAHKTNIPALDESYVFTFQQKATNLLADIRNGFEEEGLGDLASRIVEDESSESRGGVAKERKFEIREKFRQAAAETVLPFFVINDGKSWRKVNYEMDIASRISWDEATLEALNTLTLSTSEETGIEVAVSLAEDRHEVIEAKNVTTTFERSIVIDPVFAARHLLDVVPNPWRAYEFAKKTLAMFSEMHDKKAVLNNFVFIIEELRKHLERERDRLAEKVFHELLDAGTLRFMIVGKELGFHFPKTITAKPYARTFTRADGQPLAKNLFDFIDENDFNELEKDVAYYLEDQDKLFFWFRNVSRQDYALQGWRKGKIYPDFIFTRTEDKAGDHRKVFVVETKGLHLKNEDTGYKQSMFELCNRATEKDWQDVELMFKKKSVKFEVVFDDEWKNKLNGLLAE